MIFFLGNSGFGYTLGNSIRRTLLSSIPGAAVTGIRVNNALHEFTALEGVKEDLTEIVLNIKNLVLSSDNDEPNGFQSPKKRMIAHYLTF